MRKFLYSLQMRQLRIKPSTEPSTIYCQLMIRSTKADLWSALSEKFETQRAFQSSGSLRIVFPGPDEENLERGKSGEVAEWSTWRPDRR